MPEYCRPRRVESVAELCEVADVLVTEAGWVPEDRTRVALAMGEALANAVEHGGGEDDLLRVRLDLDGATLDVCVSDGGDGPDPDRLADAELPSDPLATEGRGLYILRTVADAVRVDARGGLCVTVCARS